MHPTNYTDLIAWQKAMGLVEAVYSLSSAFPCAERFGLTAQMRRAAISVPSNIAEGQGRRTAGEFLNHLSVALGSIRELETHAILAERLRFVAWDQITGLLSTAAEVGRLVTGLANSLERRSPSKGSTGTKGSTAVRTRH
jgi:four helix bundle protein